MQALSMYEFAATGYFLLPSLVDFPSYAQSFDNYTSFSGHTLHPK
jgi:hypothetical protein